MNCHSVRAVLDLFAEGRLTARRGTKVAAHLEKCAECRKFAVVPDAPSVMPAGRDFKARLAAALKAERKAAEKPVFAPKLELWPSDLSGVALACAAVAAVAIVIGWSGVPSQRDLGRDELSAWRTP